MEGSASSPDPGTTHHRPGSAHVGRSSSAEKCVVDGGPLLPQVSHDRPQTSIVNVTLAHQPVQFSSHVATMDTAATPELIKLERRGSAPIKRRVSRACDHCHRMRTRCNGQVPCSRCLGTYEMPSSCIALRARLITPQNSNMFASTIEKRKEEERCATPLERVFRVLTRSGTSSYPEAERRGSRPRRPARTVTREWPYDTGRWPIRSCRADGRGTVVAIRAHANRSTISRPESQCASTVFARLACAT
jgi:hypothetical protein